jgi:hypothetical protein
LEDKVINEDYSDLLLIIDDFKQKLKNNEEKPFIDLEKLSISDLKELKSQIHQKLHERGRLF